jgi:translation initiation factor IF-2
MAANQNTSLLKVNQLSKDLNMKSKDLNELLAGKGITLKTQQTLKPEEFNLVFETITLGHQIENIEDYLDGITYIPSKKKAAEAKPKEEPLAQEPAKASAKAEEKPAVQESKATKEPVKVQSKVESVSSTEKTEKKEKDKKIEKPVSKAEPVKTQERKSENSERPAQKPQTYQGAARQGVRAEGGQRPQGQGQYGQRPQGQYGQKPQGQQAQGQNKGDRFQNPFGAGQRQQGGQRPQGQNQGGFRQGGNNDRFGGGQFKDKDDRSQNAPREKFKPQLIVRGQTEKGEVASKQKGATRVVDMRAGSVDLSKYDERLDNFVPDSIGDIRGGSQKVKKQPAQNKNMQQGGKNNKFNKGKKSTQPVTKAPTSVTLPAEIVVSDLASRLKVTSGEVVKRLMMLGMMVTVNQTVDYDTAAIVAEEMGISATQEVVVTIEERLFDEVEDNEDTLVERAPVVCVMGHVDHGKTSILDAIRNTHVTRGEAGGITQHIGAYRVKVNGNDITFLDTPGHEAFTAMRARGAQATDIAILVVAADDGIMPQTIEAINHAKAAGIDIVVAINKMDKPTANPDAIKQELTKYDLVPEEWGGDVICVPVSALTGFGIEDLLENVLLVAEVKELKANPNRRAKGIVIEAKLDKGRGPVATVLVQNGTLHNGDIVIAGTSVGRVRAMTDDKGRTVKEAKPSVPVEIIGLAEVPNSGDEFNAVEDERMARALADQRREKAKEEVFKANARANLNDLFAQISEGVKELNIIVKADVGGSVEAVKQSLEKISNEEVKVRVIHGAAGAIREGDVMLAAASNAIIVGFNVRPDKAAIDSAERQNVEIRTYRVIYDCINEITDAMKGMLAPKFRENLLGHAEVRQTIHVPNVGTIAGSYIQDGKVTRASMIRVVRDGVVIFEDKISSLRRFKDDVKEVATGYECGIGLDRFNDIKVGDVLEAYIMEEIER